MSARSENEVVEQIQAAQSAGRAVEIVGRGQRRELGVTHGSELETLSTRALSGMTRFAPGDLTCGVLPGTTLEEIEACVEAKGLGLEPGPVAHGQRTIAGLLGEAPPSPRGFDRGAWRSQLIGMRAVDASGRVFKTGGQVVKNVAGYDLSKLFVGSGGAYFAALELQLRLVPLPERARWLASQPLALDEAYRMWLEMRERLVDARAIDLVVDGASARIEALVAGPAALVDELTRRSGLAEADDAPSAEDVAAHVRQERAAWSAPTQHAARVAQNAEAADCVARGRVRPSRARQLVGACADDVVGRIHAQGAFVLGTSSLAAQHVPDGSVLGGLRGLTPCADSAKAKIAARLKRCFGGGFSPLRAAFDVALPEAATESFTLDSASPAAAQRTSTGAASVDSSEAEA